MIALLAVSGLVAGAMLPWIIARIPDRPPAEGTRPASSYSSYRDLAARRGLPVILALATCASWTLIGWSGTDLGVATTAVYALVAALGVAMAYIDIREHRLPDWLTFPALGVAAIGMAAAAALSGQWTDYGRAWAGAVAAVAFYLVLALLRPSDLGLGDVKLAGTIGLLLGWISWPVLIFGIFAGFVVGALVGVVLLVLGRAGRRSAIPFGPAMLVGALIAVTWGESVVEAYLAL
ncbi:prepilin peptidase [Actinobacteria bacterium YIM 96077]|uniref:Prepilin peptidase n=1 Tax=Phytoactinopolyspora halophila TaxID=1981511 RepID=A0A329QGI9_9ACTN|nr:A24 family peptidase [Phytoactinopolyspora halophila]AYY13445.1 prepilin peptidase [Actinobacteria bacterium YIM 96077]RAW10839.1 prepilin peptidase [Phytoactinopolyspora halophila]